MGRRPFPVIASPVLALRRWRLLVWAAAVALLCGGLLITDPIENALRISRNAIAPERASGDIVLIGIDEKSLAQVGEWPWPRSTTAKLVDQAAAAGADRVFLDLLFDNPTRPEEDRAMADALQRYGRAVLPVRGGAGVDGSWRRTTGEPLAVIKGNAPLASIGVKYNYQNAVWHLDYTADHAGGTIPSFAAAMARAKGSGEFDIHYAIDPRTVPAFSAADLLKGRIPRAALAGKTLILAINAEVLGDQFWIPGRGRMAGAYVQILGAETLKRGSPVSLGWLAPLALVIAMLGWAVSPRSARWRPVMLTSIASALLVGPFLLQQRLIFVDVVPALLAVAIVSGRVGWLGWRARGLVNTVSGLPNLTALRDEKTANGRVLIAARVHNFAEIGSSVAAAEEQDLVRQIAERLAVAPLNQRVFQGEEGIFVWLVDSGAMLGNHLEALHALFRSPFSAGGRSIDLAISFGAELGSARSIANRLGSALVAADEAWAEGLKWKYHDPMRQEELKWRLSLLGELDAAIDHGEVWLAYQPQLDLKTGLIIGAEALARWTHPDKGPIGPTEFVAAAEAHGRIGKLTDFVLNRAIGTAASINRSGIPFHMAVNLSARLLPDRYWVERVQTLLKEHGLAPERLTLELTETASLHDADGGMAMLDAFRSLGVRIAVDDYGTGLSTLDYLKKVPAQEIKLDGSFIKAMRVNSGDRLMVSSTIDLVHSLGRTVVAEGVEDRQSLDELRAMGCDVAQGFIIGRPMGVRELLSRLQVRNQRQVA
jgi:EAL domain-containing protein (putative c-di-GMP-specific phosphodiesterase class I)/CHASE2 domain-containing sensor protein